MTRDEIEALALRIVLATMDRDQIWDRAAFDAAHPEAAADRARIAGRYRTLSRTMYYPESEIRPKAEWLAAVLSEACGVESALATLRAALADAPGDDARLNLLGSITEDYCLHCGRHIPDGVCHCMRDD